jgi:hypothetical protein
VDDEWHIRIDRQYLDPAAGSGAREMERELAAGKGTVRRLFEGILDVPTADRNWRRGAEGEERVAARLAKKLDDRWVVIHDLTIGTQGANLDHLVIGPAGVFTLNTKNLKGKVTVYDKAVLHNGQNHHFLPKARDEAKKVAERLTSVTGQPVPVRSVIVLTGSAEADIKGSPRNVRVIGYLRLPRWLNGLPEVLPPAEALRLERAARDPQTWNPQPRSRRATTPPAPPSPSGARSRGLSDATVTVVTPPPPPPPAVAAVAPLSGEGPVTDVTVGRWRRYGKDRFYANAGDGTKLGYIEVATGEVVLEVADPAGAISAQLRAARRALGLGA